MRRLLFAMFLWLPAVLAQAQEPHVVTTIKPLHSLVSGVMAGVGEPLLLLRGAESPHTYSLRPSDARALERADAVIWIGPELEGFLLRPLHSLAGKARQLRIMTLPELVLHPARAGGGWDAHHDHGHRHRGTGRNQRPDPHIWLDPHNATVIVHAVASLLAEIDPDNAQVYTRNAAELATRLGELDGELSAQLGPVRHQNYLVFHDAYQYLERRYGLNAVGSVTVSAERAPGVRRLVQLRERIADANARCVFREPQFEPGILYTLIENTNARPGVLDPLGADLAPGPDAYFQLMRNLAASLRGCLN